MVTSVGLIGAPGAWVALGGVHVLEHVINRQLGWYLLYCQKAGSSDRDAVHAQSLLRSDVHPCISRALCSHICSYEKRMLCVFRLEPTFVHGKVGCKPRTSNHGRQSVFPRALVNLEWALC